MIGMLLRVGWLELKRDRAALSLSFVVPIVFFSIFAVVFGQGSGGVTAKVQLAVVDEAGTEFSKRLVEALRRESALVVRTTASAPGSPQAASEPPLDRAGAERIVREGRVPVALVLPKSFGSGLFSFSDSAESAILLADTSDPIAPQLVNGLLQKTVMTSAPDLLARSGLEQFEKYAGSLTGTQRKAVDTWIPQLREQSESGAGGSTATTGQSSGMQGIIGVTTKDVLGEKKKNPVIAFYAAGVAVMFLLFTASGTGGVLLDEIENGTLDRVLSSRVGMTRLLFGKWLFITLLGSFQIALMFTWGAVVFGVELASHLPGFLVLTPVTAAAAASFGLVLASLCKSRRQLGGLSTAVILTMSALGGSMFPRFLMSATMQKIGYATFNAWALDGYIKIFWRDEPVRALAPQLAVLAILAAVFFAVARRLARRWETV